MRKYITILFLLLLTVQTFADLPVIIGMPAKAWMKKYGYGECTTLPSGRAKFNPDYNLALEDTKYSLTAVLRSVSKPFEEFYKVEDLKTTLDGLGDDETEFEEYGADLDMSEQLVTVVKPDVILEISYVEDEASKMGPRSRYNVEVSALDAYTNDVIATINGATDLSSAPVNTRVGNFVANNMQELLSSVNEKMEETVKYGREVRITCLTRGMSFNSDKVGDQVLKYYIRDTFKELSNEGRSTNKKDTDHLQDYRVRFPLSTKIEDIGEILQNKLASVGVTVRVDKKGLGKFVVVFGE